MDTIDTHLLGHIFVSERNIDKVNAFDKYLLNLTISKILKFDISNKQIINFDYCFKP